MDKLAMILAVVALGLGAYAAFGQSTPGDATYDSSVSDLEARLATLEAENAEYRKLLGVGAPMTAEGAPAGTLEGRSHQGVPGRVAELEAKLASYDKRFESMEASAAKQPGSSGRWSNNMPAFATKGFLASAGQAEKQLGLDSSQRAQLDRVIESTQRELEDLYATPNDAGETLKDLMQPPEIKADDIENGAIRILGNFGKIRKFKQGKIPGSNETYAEAEKRIIGGGKRDARGLLTEDQAKKWDSSHSDHLFRPKGAMGSGAVVSMGFETVIDGPSDK